MTPEKEFAIEYAYRMGWIDTHEYLMRMFPDPKYTVEDCQDWTPDLLGF